MISLPTRGRRQWLENFFAHYRANQSTEPGIVMVDTDDQGTYKGIQLPENWTLDAQDRTHMTARHNRAFGLFPDEPVYAMMADDFEPQTMHWDQMLREDALKKGVAWADDKVEQRGTAPFIDGALVRSFGFIAVPVCKHLYVDTFWMELQEAAGGKSGFRPDIVVKHHSTISDATHSQRQDGGDHENYRGFMLGGGFNSLVPTMRAYLRERAS